MAPDDARSWGLWRAVGPQGPRSALVAFLFLVAILVSLFPLPAGALGSALSSVDVHAPLQRAGEVETWTVSFDLPQGGNLAGFQVVTQFPDGFAIESGRDCDVEDAEESISVSGLEVTCTIDSGTFDEGERLTTHLTRVRNLAYEATLPSFNVKFVNNLGVTVGNANSLTERIDNNFLTGLSASAADDRAGEITDWTIRLGTKNAVGANGDVRLLFPSGFAVQSDAACSISGLSGLTLELNSAQEPVCQLNSATLNAGQTYDLTLTKVKNPGWSQSPLVRVQSRNADNKLHDELNATLAVQPHLFAAASLAAANPNAGATTTYTATFTLFNAWPADGCVSLTFPSGFTLNSGGSSQWTLVSGATGSFGPTTIAGSKATACKSGGALSNPGDTISATLSNVANPAPASNDDPSQELNAALNALMSDDPTSVIDYAPPLPVKPPCISACNEPVDPGAPSPPRNLTSRVASGRVWLAWESPVDSGNGSITNYKVYRAVLGANYTAIATTDNVTTHSEILPPSGATHYYVVTAVNVVGEGQASNLISVSTAGASLQPPNSGKPPVVFLPGGAPSANPPPSNNGSANRFAGLPQTVGQQFENQSPFGWAMTILTAVAVGGSSIGFYEWRMRRRGGPRGKA